MSFEPREDRQIANANIKVREVRERLFPPTWVEALRQLRAFSSEPEEFSPTAGDLLHDLLIPTPNGLPVADADEEFHVWFFYRKEFGKLLCLYDAMSAVAAALNLTDPSESTFQFWVGMAERLLKSKGDRDVALISLDATCKLQSEPVD